MKAISLHQPYPSLCVTRQPCQKPDCPFPDTSFPNAVYSCAWEQPMVKRFETRSWPCPPALIGQPIAFASTQQKPDVRGCQEQWIGEFSVGETTDGGFGLTNYENLATNQSTWINLPLGAIVGSGRITASLPIVERDTGIREPRYVYRLNDQTIYDIEVKRKPQVVDISDQLPYGDFAVGRYAWLIEDAAPTTERCPRCWGEGFLSPRGDSDPCPTCSNRGACDPIPAKGRQRIWNWQP